MHQRPGGEDAQRRLLQSLQFLDQLAAVGAIAADEQLGDLPPRERLAGTAATQAARRARNRDAGRPPGAGVREPSTSGASAAAGFVGRLRATGGRRSGTFHDNSGRPSWMKSRPTQACPRSMSSASPFNPEARRSRPARANVSGWIEAGGRFARRRSAAGRSMAALRAAPRSTKYPPPGDRPSTRQPQRKSSRRPGRCRSISKPTSAGRFRALTGGVSKRRWMNSPRGTPSVTGTPAGMRPAIRNADNSSRNAGSSSAPAGSGARNTPATSARPTPSRRQTRHSCPSTTIAPRLCFSVRPSPRSLGDVCIVPIYQGEGTAATHHLPEARRRAAIGAVPPPAGLPVAMITKCCSRGGRLARRHGPRQAAGLQNGLRRRPRVGRIRGAGETRSRSPGFFCPSTSPPAKQPGRHPAHEEQFLDDVERPVLAGIRGVEAAVVVLLGAVEAMVAVRVPPVEDAVDDRVALRPGLHAALPEQILRAPAAAPC